jgi:hypothetical protein
MLIENSFEVAQSIDRVWTAFDDIPGIAACLPGAELTDNPEPDKYLGRVVVRMGPVKLQFAGRADIVDRDNAAKRLVVDASGADEKGHGQAAMIITAALVAAGQGTRVDVRQDLQLSGAAAQFGRGMVADVSSVLMRDFATNLQNRMAAIERGEDPSALSAAPASGFGVGVRAMRMALMRVFARFFLPYGYRTRSAA